MSHPLANGGGFIAVVEAEVGVWGDRAEDTYLLGLMFPVWVSVVEKVRSFGGYGVNIVEEGYLGVLLSLGVSLMFNIAYRVSSEFIS